MSDTPQGGWWKASDGKWYPPETHPDQAGYVGADPFGEPVSAAPAAGWWQANDGNWYPPDSVPGPVIDLGEDLGPELPAHLSEADLTVAEPEIDLTERPDITADDAGYEIGSAADAAGTSTSAFWGESVLTTAPPLTSDPSPELSELDVTPVNGVVPPLVEPEPEISVVEEPVALVGDADPEVLNELPGTAEESIETVTVEPESPASPFGAPASPFGAPPSPFDMPGDPLAESPVESPPEPRSLFAAPSIEQSETPPSFGAPPDSPLVSPVSPFAVPADSAGAAPGSLFGAPPPVEDAAVSHVPPYVEPAIEPPPLSGDAELLPGALPITPPDADPRRGLFDLDDRPPGAGDQTAKRPLFGGTPAPAPAEQPPAIEFDATGSDPAPMGVAAPISSAKPMKPAGDRKRLLVLLGVLAGVVVVGGLLFVLLGRGGDETAEGTTTVPGTGSSTQESTPATGDTQSDGTVESSGADSTAVAPTTVLPPAEIPAQVSGSGPATADLGHDVSDMLLALITHDGPGAASFDLLGADGSVVQQLVGPGVSGQYLGVVPVNFAQGQSFRSVRFNGEGPWAVTFAVTTSAPAISTSSGSTFSESGDRVVLVDGSGAFRLQTSCDACTTPLQIRAWQTGATTAPEALVADGGIVEVPGGTAWLQITAPGAESTMPGWTLTVG